MKRKKQELQSGQVGLIVLLTMIVAATIAISVSTRSIAELKTSRQEQQSTGAFEDAESAVQKALQDLTNTTQDITQEFDANTNYKVSASQNLSMQDVPAGKSISVELGSDANKMLNVTWDQNPTNCNLEAAIAIAFFNANGSEVKRFAYDGCNTRAGVNNFTVQSTRSVSFDNAVIGANIVLARIKVLYNQTDLTVSGSNINDQLYTVNATATGADGETRSIEAQRGLPMAPSIFDYVLFSGSGNL